MIKVKDFYTKLCTELNYRFFAGVPTKDLRILYDNMDPEMMHYIPAVDEKVALNLACGAGMSGYKSVVLLSADSIDNVELYHSRLNQYIESNILFIVEKDTDTKYKKLFLDSYVETLEAADRYLHEYSEGSCVLVIEEGSLHE